MTLRELKEKLAQLETAGLVGDETEVRFLGEVNIPTAVELFLEDVSLEHSTSGGDPFVALSGVTDD